MVQEPKSKDTQFNLTILEGPTSLVYADRILNIGVGPVVSKLTLGMEVGPNNTFAPTTTLIIPTTSLIDALDGMQRTVHENKELKAGVIKGLDAIKEQFNKL